MYFHEYPGILRVDAALLAARVALVEAIRFEVHVTSGSRQVGTRIE